MAKGLDELSQKEIWKDIQKIKESVEKNNNCTILDIKKHEGFTIGDKIWYINVRGLQKKGRISHFFRRGTGPILPAILNEGLTFSRSREITKR